MPSGSDWSRGSDCWLGSKTVGAGSALPFYERSSPVPRLAFTRSEAEELFLELIRKADLPEPEVNVVIAGYEIDFFWRDLAVAVEIDGFTYHSSRRSFERDRSRDFALGSAGIQVCRITWRNLRDEPHTVVARLSSILTRAEILRTAEAP